MNQRDGKKSVTARIGVGEQRATRPPSVKRVELHPLSTNRKKHQDCWDMFERISMNIIMYG